MNRLLLAAAFGLPATVALAEPGYTGYSGAPGSSGSCASSCHGPPGGTIEVVGFPSAYELGQTYVISVVHSGGSSINNFNASVRTASGSHGWRHHGRLSDRNLQHGQRTQRHPPIQREPRLLHLQLGGD